ncbi:hypothetical protein [Desulfocucumis palustris]|uniref:hypothetical protein n=1 Tax=Desulfocucumis palustris TaxID=1898651 RepID=UPI000CEA13BF|nr:hypothetical protein [Desulfocucumis palustris]
MFNFAGEGVQFQTEILFNHCGQTVQFDQEYSLVGGKFSYVTINGFMLGSLIEVRIGWGLI